jgi:hypothetical protein
VASGEASLISGAPIKTAPRIRGHVNAQAELVNKLGTTDPSKHVGFALIREGDNTLRITWNSGVINSKNFGARAAPIAERPSIIQAVEKETGYKVIQ